MATVEELTTALQAANALGQKRLEAKGVTVPENPTTCDLMNLIGEVAEIQASTGDIEIILPVSAETVTAEINNSNIEIETSVALESGE